MFARIFSRQHKQTTFSDAVFLGALRINAQHGGCKNSVDILKQFFLFSFPIFMQIVSQETVGMKCQTLLSGKNKKNTINALHFSR